MKLRYNSFIPDNFDLLTTIGSGTPIAGIGNNKILFTNASGNLASSNNLEIENDALRLQKTQDLSSTVFPIFAFGTDDVFNFNGEPFGAYWDAFNTQLQWRDNSGFYYPQRIGQLTTDFLVSSGGIQANNLTLNRIPYATTGGLLIDSANFTFNGTNATINRNNLITTTTQALSLTNQTLSTAGVPVQQSPALEFLGNVWNTTAVAANNFARFRIENRPVSGTTPTSVLTFLGSRDTGTPTWNSVFSISNLGLATFPLATSATTGLRLGGDVDIFRGAANRLDIAAGDSFYIPNDSNGFALGTTPNAIYTSNNRRTTTGALSTSPAVVNCEFLINHGVTGFPSAMRMFVPINGGANNVGYAAGISAQVSVQNGHTAQANNITAADFSARWNTNQATASSNSLLGARIYSTSDNATISGSVGNLFGGSFEAGVNTAATTFTINSSIIAGEFIIRVPQLGAGTASAFGASFPNHNIGTSAPINTAGHIRLAPLTAAYGSGTRYPILFNGTNTNPNEIGIWWGTDANNVNLYRSGNRLLSTNSSVSIVTSGQGLRVAEGTNSKQGTADLVGGTVTVPNTSVTANSRIFLTSQVDGGTVGFLRVSSRIAGTSFTITSSSPTDTSTIAYEIFEPA